ncbi:MAG: universal stress protein [Synergistaceae bacterium]|nr:universal stress protein [Synergistaceae bacterium]
MFRRVIVALDLSRDSQALVSCFGALNVYGIEKCLLLQFWDMLEILGINNFYSPTALIDFKKNLQNQKEILEKQGYEVEARLLSGFSTSEINKIADEENYSAVVVGTDKDIFSPMANELIHNVEKPILIVKLDLDGEGPGISCTKAAGGKITNHVLFPTDFSKNAEQAFDCLVEMAAADKIKKITLVHVQDQYRISPYLDDRIEEFDKIDTERLENMQRILKEKGHAEVDIVLKFGSPSVKILQLVKERNVQLVVMGSQGRGFVKEFFLGSVSHNIARQSLSSVLLIPAKR